MGVIDRHGKPSLLGLIGYLILAVSVVLALWASRQNSIGLANERAVRSVELNAYLARDCNRDTKKDNIYLGTLTRSIAQVRASKRLDPAVRSAYIRRTTADIHAVRRIDRLCVSDIPPPLPSHKTG